MDLDIPNFRRFQDHLEERVKESDVLIVFIGPRWVELLKIRAESDEPDILVGEIRQALGQDHTIVATVCIDGAEIPPKESLPADIREMLEFQIPDFNDGDYFMASLHKIADDIEREYERRGSRKAGEYDLEKLFHLQHEELYGHLFEMLEQGNTLRIERILRDFPSHFLAKLNIADHLEGNSCKALLNAISIFGITFAAYDRHSLFKKFMHQMYSVFERTYKQQYSQKQNYGISNAIFFELLRMLYLLGAILIRERKFDWMRELLNISTTLEYERNMTWPWILYLQHECARRVETPERLLMYFCDEILTSGDFAYICEQFFDDDEQVKDNICQFDLIHCLSLTIHGENGAAKVWPYFGIFQLDRLNSILKYMVNDDSIRSGIFGKPVSDAFLAEWITRYCTYARSNYWSRYLGGKWKNQIPRELASFLEHNVPENLKRNPRFSLTNRLHF